jgi:hypothetical protein
MDRMLGLIAVLIIYMFFGYLINAMKSVYFCDIEWRGEGHYVH